MWAAQQRQDPACAQRWDGQDNKSTIHHSLLRADTSKCLWRKPFLQIFEDNAMKFYPATVSELSPVDEIESLECPWIIGQASGCQIWEFTRTALLSLSYNCMWSVIAFLSSLVIRCLISAIIVLSFRPKLLMASLPANERLWSTAPEQMQRSAVSSLAGLSLLQQRFCDNVSWGNVSGVFLDGSWGVASHRPLA